MQMEFFHQPLPFDPELLQSMQSSLTQLTELDTVMPGQSSALSVCSSRVLKLTLDFRFAFVCG